MKTEPYIYAATTYALLRELQAGGFYVCVDFWSYGEVQIFYKGRYSPYLKNGREFDDYLYNLVQQRRLLFKKFEPIT